MLPDSKSLPSVDGAQLGWEKKGKVARWAGLPYRTNFWEVSLGPQESGKLEAIESILIHHRHKLSGLMLQWAEAYKPL